jgi:ADP-ribosylglycohydrolase
MIGAIVGDIIGSAHEGMGTKSKDFPLFDPHCRFTDDTVLTVAVAECLLDRVTYTETFHRYFQMFPHREYGGRFREWAERSESLPYNSWGNGAAMRASPIGYAFHSIEQVLVEARRSAEVTHSHPEGIRGAQAVAAAVFLAQSGWDKSDMKRYLETAFEYSLADRLDDLRADYRLDLSCQGSVPQSIIAFLESEDFEDAIRGAISLGGDADTMACIAGAIAEAHYGGVPAAIAEPALQLVDRSLREVADRFAARFVRPGPPHSRHAND